MLTMGFARLVTALLGSLHPFRQPLGVVLAQPLITVCILVFLYAGWHVRDEGGIVEIARHRLDRLGAVQADQCIELGAAPSGREHARARRHQRRNRRLADAGARAGHQHCPPRQILAHAPIIHKRGARRKWR